MDAESRKPNRAIPAVIKRSSLSPQNQGSFVVSLADAMSSSNFHEKVQNAEREYRNAVSRWAGRVSRIEKNRSDTLLRWRLADDIATFRKHLRVKWGIEPTNIVLAASIDLGVSYSSLKYMLCLRERFTLKEVEFGRITWARYQEILDIKDDNLMKECINLVRRGVITSPRGIREFKKKANSLHM